MNRPPPPIFVALALLTLALATGCATRTSSAPAATAEDSSLAAKVQDLDAKIARLEGRLAGTGAYREGTSLRIDGGRESILDRSRRLERELQASQALLQLRDAAITSLELRLAAAEDTGRSLADENAYLAHLRESLETARQAAAERGRANEHLQAQLTASELARLRAEREHYQLAANLLRLRPNQATDIAELQATVRDQARALGTEANHGK